MTRKQKTEECGDSDDLQALFDSIATDVRASGPEPEPAPRPAAAESSSGDDDSLQALFDEVSATFESGVVAAAASAPSGAGEAAGEPGEVFNRIGHMTRQVHDTLRALGLDSESLSDAVQGIPDARQRLSYIAHMTEQAASRVLNATDLVKPLQEKMQGDAELLEARWNRLFNNDLSVDEFKMLAADTRAFLGEVRSTGEATSAQLMEIMMAQDFQDLTGQVIKKVVDLAQELETELLQLLIETMPEDKRPAKTEGLMNGPVIDTTRSDVVNTQEQVDDLLDSLGF
ncbi:MAG: protein phosphatase CheZ [Zoogloeaceae bacterium]|nr:protein phosphatase CheZ [Zoogloeaceae bacterium]